MRMRVMLGPAAALVLAGCSSDSEGAPAPAPAGDRCGRDVNWSRVSVEGAGRELFTFSPGIVAANVVPHAPPPR